MGDVFLWVASYLHRACRFALLGRDYALSRFRRVGNKPSRSVPASSLPRMDYIYLLPQCRNLVVELIFTLAGALYKSAMMRAMKKETYL